MKYYIIFGIVVIILAAAIAAAFCRKRRFAERQRKIESEAMLELQNNIKRFNGLFQILYDAVYTSNEEATSRILKRWKSQANGMSSLSILIEQLSEVKKQESPSNAGKRLLDQFKKWGIQHDSKGMLLTATYELNRFYIMDEFYENGEQLVVESPGWYWDIGEDIICIEAGIAEMANPKEKE